MLAIKMNAIDVDKILVSKKKPYGANNPFKCFTRYNDNDDIRPLCIMLAQMCEFLKC